MWSRDAVRLATLLALLATGCGDVADDLLPSARDRRAAGPGAVGQPAPDFTLSDTLGREVSLRGVLAASPGVVLYFTMWCPICDAHMAHLRSTVVPAFPEVPVLVLDYVSGSVAAARAAQLQAGWDVPALTVLADVGGAIEAYYGASMAVVVIGRDGVIRMNGEYDWPRLQAALSGLPRGAGGAP